LLDCRQQKAHEDGDDGDDHEKFDQGESGPGTTHAHGNALLLKKGLRGALRADARRYMQLAYGSEAASAGSRDTAQPGRLLIWCLNKLVSIIAAKQAAARRIS